MSVIGLKVPGALNSKVVPSASPTANPSSAPRYRSRIKNCGTLLLRCAQVLTQLNCAGVSGDSGFQELFTTVLHFVLNSAKASSGDRPCSCNQHATTSPVRPTPPQQC